MKSAYLAAQFARREELHQYRDQLEALGIEVTSRWLSGAHGTIDSNKFERSHREVVADRNRCAQEDREDIKKAEAFITWTEIPYGDKYPGTGGRHVEFGVAWDNNKRLIIIGYRENVFHDLYEAEFYPTWEEFLTAIKLEQE